MLILIALFVATVVAIGFFLRFYKRFKSDPGTANPFMLAISGSGSVIAAISLIFMAFSYVFPPKSPEIPKTPEIYFSGSGMTMQSNDGKIFYTLDGTEPSISHTAFEYNGEAIHVLPGQIFIAKTKNEAGWGTAQIRRGDDLQKYYLGAKNLGVDPVPIEVLEQDSEILEQIPEVKKTDPDKVVLNYNKKTMKVGEKAKLNAIISPEPVEDVLLAWTCDQKDVIVRVSNDGIVEALNPGAAIVRVSFNDKIYDVCSILVEPTDIVESSVTERPSVITQVQKLLEPEVKAQPETKPESSSLVNTDIPTVNEIPSGDIPKVDTSKRVTVSSIKIPETKSINVGETDALLIEYYPEDASNKNTQWNSSDPNIVKVNDYGSILGLNKGTATITAMAGNMSAICVVTVNEVIIPLETIKIRDASEDAPFDLEVGASQRVRYDLTPTNATVSGLEYEVSDTSIATVDQYGNVVGKAVGITTLIVSVGELKATCIFRVTPAVFVDSIILSDPELELPNGANHVLTATINPPEAARKKITWTSSDPDIASVKDGVITANKEGYAIITASVGSTTAECKIKVNAVPVESVILSASDIEVSAGRTEQLSYEFYPKNATVKSLHWKSSDDKIARVVDGNIIGMREGTAFINLTVDGITERCTVTVVPVVYESIEFSDTAIYIEADTSIKLGYSVSPSGADPRTITWISSNTQVADVIDGIVQGKSEGITWITASIGDVRAYCMVNVTATPVREIYLSESQIDLEMGDTADFSYTIQPAKANNRKITVNSDNENVVKVYNGKIYALAVGWAKLIVSADGVQASCDVVVHPISPKSIILDTYTLELEPGEQETIGFMLDPIQADRDAIDWNVSNSSILSVDNGVVTALREGTTTVTAYYGKITASCTVAIKKKLVEAESILLPELSSTINIGDVWELIPVITPSNTTDKTLYWESNQPDVVYVDQNGRLQALTPGDATITVQCGNVSQSFTLHVSEPIIMAESILLPELSSTINIGDVWELTPIVTPSNTTDKTLTWASDQPDIVYVDQNGKLQALALGDAIITVQCGNILQSFVLHVTIPIKQ